MSNLPRHERGIFFILIIDIILRSTFIVFSLLCATIITKTRGLFVTYFRSTLIIAMLSIQYWFYLYYCEIHLCRYIIWYCPYAHDYFVICLCFILNYHRNLLFSQRINMCICGIFEHNLFAADKEIYYLWFLIINNQCRNQVPVIRTSYHWNTEQYEGFVDHCEGDH